MTTPRIVLTLALVAAIGPTACTGEKSPDQLDSRAMDSSLAVWRARQQTAESLSRAAPEVSEVVKQLGGKLYDVADAEIEAAVKREAEKTSDCYTKARRDFDPDLSVVLYVLVNYGAAGWDIMRVERSNATSAAGNAVVACINSRAKAEWKLPERSVKPGAHLVKLIYTPPDSSKRR